MKHTDNLAPVKSSERYIILDALRGFALLGICMANFPEFSLYTFLKAEAAAAFPSAGMDSITRYLLYVFVDGKFYTLFSLLFGIGFSIIISNAARKGANGFRIFYRRMFLLACIGFLHLMFIWSGDILMLYALLGMLLPLFRHASDRTLLVWAAALLLIPVGIDLACELCSVYPAQPVVSLQQYYCARYGITSDNFAYWLRDAQDYQAVFQFLIQGALVRVQEFIDGNRYFKVMGLFLIGFYIGRREIYASLEERKEWLQGLCRYGLLIGLPLSLVYAWSCQNGHPWGLTVHSLLYLVSTLPPVEKGRALATACCPRPHGLDMLHRPVRHRHVPVLRHRPGMGRRHRFAPDRRHRAWAYTSSRCCSAWAGSSSSDSALWSGFGAC